jgi:hypothetical protein
MFQNLCNWRFFAALILGGIVVACTQPRVEEEKIVYPEWVKVCPPGENIAVCFFDNAQYQGEDYGEPYKRPVNRLKDAIRDALTLPLEGLKAKRYSDDLGFGGQWSLHKLFNAHFISDSSAQPEHEGFYEALKQPDAIHTLESWLEYFEEAAIYYEKLVDENDDTAAEKYLKCKQPNPCR